MVQVSCSEDVYCHFVEESADDWLFGLICFAILEEQRIEWSRHFASLNGRSASSDEVANWYSQQPPGVLLRARGMAENALQHYATDVVQAALTAERQSIAEGVIVGEIRMARRFWPQFGINVAAGLASALVFAAILTAVAVVVLADVSPVRIFHERYDRRSGEVTNEEAHTPVPRQAR
jgi:hypothetical protein